MSSLQAIVAWPVAKLLETILGPHHGIIYRRGELKELINMHSSISPHGGDLKHDTVNIIGRSHPSASYRTHTHPVTQATHSTCKKRLSKTP
jgi:hypothetical protein